MHCQDCCLLLIMRRRIGQHALLGFLSPTDHAQKDWAACIVRIYLFVVAPLCLFHIRRSAVYTVEKIPQNFISQLYIFLKNSECTRSCITFNCSLCFSPSNTNSKMSQGNLFSVWVEESWRCTVCSRKARKNKYYLKGTVSRDFRILLIQQSYSRKIILNWNLPQKNYVFVSCM